MNERERGGGGLRRNRGTEGGYERERERERERETGGREGGLRRNRGTEGG